jgi:hypothetical protein
MKLAFFPLELAKPLLRKTYTRDAYAPLLCRGISWEHAGRTLRPQTEPRLAKPFQSAAKALQLQITCSTNGCFGRHWPWKGVSQTFVSGYLRSLYVNSQVDGRYINRGRSLLTRREKCRAMTLYEILSLN